MMGGMGDGWGVERRRGGKGNGHSDQFTNSKDELKKKPPKTSVFHNQNPSFHE